MPDFLSMFDLMMNVFSVAKAAGDVDESESSLSKNKRIEDIEDDTKDKTHKVVDRRKKELKERRASQSSVSNRYQHKR